MTIDLSNVSVAGIDVDYSQKLNSADDYGNLDITFKGRINAVSDVRYELKGMLEIVGMIRCANCLEEVLYSDGCEVLEIFSNEENIGDDAWPINRGMAEIGDAVATVVYRVLPMKTLCKDGCKGLCPICGKDLNEGSCNCEAPGDSRFDVLSSFFEDKEV